VRDLKAPLGTGQATWQNFDPEVLGGHYTGHHGEIAKVSIAIAPGADRHPIVRGLQLSQLVGNGSLYKAAPLAGSTTPLLIGSIPDQSAEPIAWTNVSRNGGGRVFYTSLGHAGDFDNPAFRKLLVNGICWALDIAAPAAAPTDTAAKRTASE
jgi:type 1 glutamine amidotransferase